jgi:hypothetical protein
MQYELPKVFSSATISVGPHGEMYGTGDKVFVVEFKVLHIHYLLAEE